MFLIDHVHEFARHNLKRSHVVVDLGLEADPGDDPLLPCGEFCTAGSQKNLREVLVFHKVFGAALHLKIDGRHIFEVRRNTAAVKTLPDRIEQFVAVAHLLIDDRAENVNVAVVGRGNIGGVNSLVILHDPARVPVIDRSASGFDRVAHDGKHGDVGPFAVGRFDAGRSEAALLFQPVPGNPQIHQGRSLDDLRTVAVAAGRMHDRTDRTIDTGLNARTLESVGSDAVFQSVVLRRFDRLKLGLVNADLRTFRDTGSLCNRADRQPTHGFRRVLLFCLNRRLRLFDGRSLNRFRGFYRFLFNDFGRRGSGNGRIHAFFFHIDLLLLVVPCQAGRLYILSSRTRSENAYR